MVMIIEYQDNPIDENSRILEILTECNNEFVPPLSGRSSTTQKDLSGADNGSGVPYEYYKKIMTQKMLVSKINNDIAGFMSFIENFSSDIIESGKNVYISTIIVGKKYRRMGITSKFYKELLDRYNERSIYTRTWSTNTSHMSLLEKIGFCEYKRIENDRGIGIDTVYYVYKCK